MSTVFVVGVPAGGSDDLTFRARRVLAEAALVLAADAEGARRLLAECGIDTPVAPAGQDLPGAETGNVALLLPGHRAAPGPLERGWLCAALEHGRRVEPVPGPVGPLVALVLSGLPADSFVYLGEPAGERGRALLAGLAREPRTLVLQVAAGALPAHLALLHEVLGERPLVLVPEPGGRPAEPWRGTTAQAVAGQALETLPSAPRWSIVVGGAPQATEPWDEDRLRAEIVARLAQGQAVGQVSRELAVLAGWPRRAIYRLAVAAGEHPPSRQGIRDIDNANQAGYTPKREK